jgi:hypothetical protein
VREERDAALVNPLPAALVLCDVAAHLRHVSTTCALANLERLAASARAISLILSPPRAAIALVPSRTSRARVPPHSGSADSAAPIRTLDLASKRSRAQITAVKPYP